MAKDMSEVKTKISDLKKVEAKVSEPKKEAEVKKEVEAKKEPKKEVVAPSGQFDALQSLVKINSILDTRAKEQGIIFATMEKQNRIRGAVSTGCYSFDLIMGGGYAPGTFSYIYGPTGSGKSSLLFLTIKEAIEKQMIVCFQDHECSADPAYLEKIGVMLQDVCGFRNKKGEWEKTPKLRYSVGTTAESTFKFMNQVMKALPDKVTMQDPGTKELRHFLVDPEYSYNVAWRSINDGLKDKKIIEVESNSPQIMFLVDSLKAMLPDAKDENIDSDPIAMLARTLHTCFPLIKSLLGRKNCLFVATNHLTINPMQRFGCLHADTVVPFVDGRSLTMREIVEKKIQGDVWSYDEIAKKMIPSKIIDWHFNGNVETPDDFVTVTCEAIDTRNGVASFTCTRNHEVMTLDGWKQAGKLTSDDLLLSKYQSVMNGSLKSFLIGTMVGDCTIAAKQADWVHTLRFQDNTNLEYVQWKIGKLEDYIPFRHINSKLPSYVSGSRHEFNIWKRRLGKRDPTVVFDQMDDLSLAIWFMDDGHSDFDNGHCRGVLSVKRLKGDVERLIQLKTGFASRGLECSIGIADGSVHFNKTAFLALCERICRYVPDCMQYKLPPEFRGRYQEFELFCEPAVETEYVQVLSVVNGSLRKFRQKGKYDICVYGTHNYLVGNTDNGVIVHNSPETEPGGSAVQFYPDFKMKLNVNRAQSKIESEPHISGIGEDRYLYGYATVLKNKFGPSFRKADFRVWLDERGEAGRGIDPVFDTYNFLGMTQLIHEDEEADQYKVLIDGFNDQTFTWTKFKDFILNQTGGKALRNHCQRLLNDGKAQELYYENMKDKISEKKRKKENDEDKPVEV